MKYTVGLAGLFFAILTKVLYSIGSEHSWFWHYSWYDLIMHFLGGLAVGFLLSYMLCVFMRDHFLLSWVLWGTVLIVVIWEIYEYIFDIYGAGNYVADTSIDMFLGLAGSALAYTLSKKVIEKSNHHHESEQENV